MTAAQPPHHDRVAVVTGAARGFGAAIAESLAASGAAVALIDRDDASAVADRITESGGTAWAHVADVTDEDAVTGAAEQILKQTGGRVDILVNNAGIIEVRGFFDTDYTAWRRVQSINLDSQFLLAKAFVPRMRERGWGRVVNIASNTFGLAASHLTAYIASKGGVIGFTRGLASDLAPHGITVNAVAPTASRTPGGVTSITEENLQLSAQLQSIKRVGVADDIVGTVNFLASDAAAFMTGQTLVVDGGWVRS